MNAHSRTALAAALAIPLAACLIAAPAQAQVTFYEHDNYQGRTFSTEREVQSLMDYGFNDRASSIVVTSRSWEVCDDRTSWRFSGGERQPSPVVPVHCAELTITHYHPEVRRRGK